MLRKYSLVTIFAALSAPTLLQSTALADGSDHWAKLNQNTLIGKISLAMRAKVKHVPSIQEASVPVYPNAKIYLYAPHGFSSFTEKVDQRALPRFSLASNDSPVNIVNFYESHLPGYKRVKAKMSESTKDALFLKDTGRDAGMVKHLKLSFNLVRKLMRHPSVYIIPAGSMSTAALPGANSVIYITYRPQQSRQQEVTHG